MHIYLTKQPCRSWQCKNYTINHHPCPPEKALRMKCFLVLFAFGGFYCFAVLLCFAQCYSLREFIANKITLKPQGFNITFAMRKYHSDEVGISFQVIRYNHSYQIQNHTFVWFSFFVKIGHGIQLK